MAKVALIIAVLALVIAVLAYQEAGGARALQENIRTLQGALEAARKETADALARMERALRSSEPRESAPPKQ
jgi:type II secretory pathway pseudopilin PulG